MKIFLFIVLLFIVLLFIVYHIRVVLFHFVFLKWFDMQSCDWCILRFRRSTHVTPKTYLSFLSSYKSVFTSKASEIGGMATRIETGLAKLQDASETVEKLKTDLAVMEQELAKASETAEKASSSIAALLLHGLNDCFDVQVLVEVTHRAKEAETTKNHVQLAKDRAQRLVDVIAADKEVAEAKLEDARPALEEAEAALNTIKPAHIGFTRNRQCRCD